MAISTIEDGRYLEVNELFLKSLGLARDEVIGRTSRELNLFSDYRQREKILTQMQENGYVTDFDVTIRRPDGKVLNGQFSAQIIELQQMELPPDDL